MGLKRVATLCILRHQDKFLLLKRRKEPNKDNVRQAIETVQPFGLDLCSSVRTEGKLDRHKLKDFFSAIGYN